MNDKFKEAIIAIDLEFSVYIFYSKNNCLSAIENYCQKNNISNLTEIKSVARRIFFSSLGDVLLGQVIIYSGRNNLKQHLSVSTVILAERIKQVVIPLYNHYKKWVEITNADLIYDILLKLLNKEMSLLEFIVNHKEIQLKPYVCSMAKNYLRKEVEKTFIKRRREFTIGDNIGTIIEKYENNNENKYTYDEYKKAREILTEKVRECLSPLEFLVFTEHHLEERKFVDIATELIHTQEKYQYMSLENLAHTLRNTNVNLKKKLAKNMSIKKIYTEYYEK